MGLWDAVTSLPAETANAILESIRQMLIGFVQPLLEATKHLVTMNINPYDFQGMWLAITGIISAFYLLLFLIVGLKFLLGSYSAVQRAEAKEWFKNAILIVILVSASLLIYSLLLDLASGIATALWNNELEQLFLLDNLNMLDLLWIGILALFTFTALVTLAIRQIILIMGVMFFPIGLFLYFIGPLKQYGSIALNILSVTIFMQVLDVIILIAVQAFWTQFVGLPIMNLLAPCLGFLLIAIANIFIIYMAAKKALSSIGVNLSVSATAKEIIGPAVIAAGA